MKKTLLLYALLLLTGAFLPSRAAETGAKISSLSGPVSLKPAQADWRPAREGRNLEPGDTVATGDNASAVVTTLDGSTLTLSAHSQITLVAHQKPAGGSILFRARLALGEVLCRVRKLVGSRSRFELKAGGVVCGVRGTKFSLSYDPPHDLAVLKVLDGTVWSDLKGQLKTHGKGEAVEFHDGKSKPWIPPPAGKGKDDVGEAGRKHGGKPLGGVDGLSRLTLQDLKQGLGRGLGTDADNSLTDPAVQGGVRLKVNIRLGQPETLP